VRRAKEGSATKKRKSIFGSRGLIGRLDALVAGLATCAWISNHLLNIFVLLSRSSLSRPVPSVPLEAGPTNPF
jgi:hypothetical protein